MRGTTNVLIRDQSSAECQHSGKQRWAPHQADHQTEPIQGQRTPSGNDVQLAIDQGRWRFNARMISAADNPRTKLQSARLPDMLRSPNRAQFPLPDPPRQEARPTIAREHPTQAPHRRGKDSTPTADGCLSAWPPSGAAPSRPVVAAQPYEPRSPCPPHARAPSPAQPHEHRSRLPAPATRPAR
jgi:hypothetical protein